MGFGDIEGLAEKTASIIDEKQAKKLTKKISVGATLLLATFVISTTGCTETKDKKDTKNKLWTVFLIILKKLNIFKNLLK